MIKIGFAKWFLSLIHIRTFALIVSTHSYCARKFARHVMHERAPEVVK